MPSYLLRTIDPTLWARVKARAAQDDIPLRSIIIALLELYATRKVSVASTIVAKTVALVVCCAILVGCGGPQASPVAPTVIHETVFIGPPALPPAPPGPHFALELQAQSQTTYEGEPWVGLVSVNANPSILRPELPVRVTTTCGATVQAHPLGSGSARIACLLPVGSHSIGAVAEMGDGRRYPTAITATVLAQAVQVLPLHYSVIESGRGYTDVAFGFHDFAGADYRWRFGDGEEASTRLNGVQHRYSGGSEERRASVTVTKDGRTLATGSVVGRW